VSLPDFDPDHGDRALVTQRRNRAIEDTFEPGAAMSAITVAAGLDSGHFSNDMPVGIDPRLVLERSVRRSTTSLDHIVEENDQNGLAMIAITIGIPALGDTLRSFGFGMSTGVDLPGERAGTVTPRQNWSLSDLEAYARGERLRVTPLQLVNAYAAIAANGQLPRPHLVMQIIGPGSATKNANAGVSVRRACSARTAEFIRRYLSDAYNRYSNHTTSHGITIAGSAILSRNTHAFVGMSPALAPRIVALVELDHGGPNTGKIIGDVFRDVTEAAIERFR